jgi:hypothetical protein
MPETPAQRAARERNLRRGNPNSYSKPAEGQSTDPPRAAEAAGPPAAEGAAEGARGPAIRARPRAAEGASSAPPRKKPAAPRAKPSAPESAPREKPPGFFGGLADGLFG